MNAEWYYWQPVQVRFGLNVFDELGNVVIQKGYSRGLLVTSQSAVRNGLLDRAKALCGEAIVAFYSGVRPNPDVEQCDICVGMLREHRCDFVIALGGGSVLDCAKAAACISIVGGAAADFLSGEKCLPSNSLPVIAIPTTAGTGSEVTPVAVLSDHKRGVKVPMCSQALYPQVAIVDPALTLTASPRLTACTGFDVLCHAIEAYWSRKHQPVCDALALHAARLVLDNLAAACSDPSDIKARTAMAEASTIAGMAFAIPRTNSSHACSYPLTSIYGMPHGEACALTIDIIASFNSRRDDGRTDQLAKALGYPSADDLADAIYQLKKETGMRLDLSDLHLQEADIDRLVNGSINPMLNNNPAKINADDLRHLYETLALGRYRM